MTVCLLGCHRPICRRCESESLDCGHRRRGREGWWACLDCADRLEDMLREAGFKPQTNLIDYTTEYLPKYLTSAGKFEGIVYRSGVASGNNAVIWLDWRYRSGGGDGWIGFDAAGKGDGSGDPQVDQLILKARAEVDTEKRRALVYDLQRYLAKAQYAISEPGTAAYKTGLRDAIMSTKELVGTHGVYNFKPDDRYGSDQRAVVIVRMEKGQWKLAP